MQALRLSPSDRARHRAGSSGFTLIELLITISIVAILAALAVPAFDEAVLNSKLNSVSSNFMASAQLARSEAIKRNAPVTLCASSDGTTCVGTWENGWVVRAADGTVISRQSPLPNGYMLSEAGGVVTSIVFQPTGVGATLASLTLCRATPTVGSRKRTLDVSLTGRPNVTKQPATSCP